MPENTSEDFLIRWNYFFPLDRWWRQKYGKSLFSPEHLEVNQYDITLEYLEEQMFEKYYEKAKQEETIEKEYKQGVWLRRSEDKFTQKELGDLFDKIDVSSLNQQEKAKKE